MALKRNWPFALILIAGLFLFPSVEGTVRGFLWLPYRLIAGQKARELESLGIPRGGEWILPPETQSMLALLRRARAESYRPSDRIRGDMTLIQRLTEGAYPLEYEAQSPWLLSFTGEPLSPGCSVLDRSGGVLLARCP